MIIDTHVHIGKMLGFYMPEEMVIKSMEKYNINFSLISNIESAEYDKTLQAIPIKNQYSQIESLEKIKDFNELGYKFSEELSSNDSLVFIRAIKK